MMYKGDGIMKQTLEKLWSGYLLDKCAVMDAEEKALLKQAIELQKTANALLTKEQREAVERYIDA